MIFYTVRLNKELGSVRCEAKQCRGKDRARDFLLTEEEWRSLPKTGGRQTFDILFHDGIGKPVCIACQMGLQTKGHSVLRGM